MVKSVTMLEMFSTRPVEIWRARSLAIESPVLDSALTSWLTVLWTRGSADSP